MKEISIKIDDKDEVEFKTDGLDPIKTMQLLAGAIQQILNSLKVRQSGVIKPATINQAMGINKKKIEASLN